MPSMSDERFRDRTQTVQVPISDCSDKAPSLQGILTVIRGGGADLGRSYVVGLDAWIGRSPKSELKLNDLGVSWSHARIWAEDTGQFFIEDVGSTNGTRLNGRPIEDKVRLKDGDKILLGRTVVRFSLVDELEAGFHKEVAQLVGTDPLTGLESKRCFDDALDKALAGSLKRRSPVVVLMMDMDNTKAINDRHGHLFGAYCIQQAGRIIGAIVGQQGHVCRFGGDEFTAFLPGLDRQAGLEFGERIREAVAAAEIALEGIALQPTISVGVAVFPEDAEDVLDLLAAADSALYRAKARGKNRVSD